MLALAFVLGPVPAGRASAQSLPLRIAAAADLQPVLPAVIAEFKASHPGIDVTASYQSSATLTTQIQSGAPLDLFLAADMSFPQRLISAGMGDSADPVPYARGTLVLWARKDSRFNPLTIAALQDTSLKTLAIADPGHAPYGRAAMAAITSLHLNDPLKARLVVAENIAQAAQYVDSGNAELGLISLTSALTERLRADGAYIEMPPSSYPPILQAGLVIKNSTNRQLAHEFLHFLLSASVQQELSTKGLKPPG